MDKNLSKSKVDELKRKSFWLAVFVTGFSSMLTQIVALREALSGFYGNELIVGIFLGNWLLVSGLGAYLGSRADGIKDKLCVFACAQILTAFLAPVVVLLTRVVRTYMLAPGEMVGFIPTVGYSLLILLPFCVVSGLRFPLAASIVSEKRREEAYGVSNIYAVECMGNLASGFLFSFLFVRYLNPFQTIFIVVILSLFSAWLLAREAGNKRISHLTVMTMAFTVILSFSIHLDTASMKLQFPGQTLLHHESSPYGEIAVTETEGQLNFYENAFPLFSTENTQANEEKVHYAMLQHQAPKNVLLISGGVSGTTAEVLKYNPNRIDYVEIDPKIIEVGREYTRNLDDGRINVYSMDGRLFVKKKERNYDVVLIDLPDPQSIQVNRFYTLEFLREVKEVLNEGGILSLSLSGGENYLSEEARNLNSAVYQTLKEVFDNILIVPGAKNYFIASDAPLDYDYAKKMREKKIETRYFEYYLPGVLAQDRIDYVLTAVKEGGRINRDFTPISQFYYSLYWMSIFKVNYKYVLALILLATACALCVLRVKPIPLNILVTGFSAMSVELVLIFSFQIIYGFVYNKVGLIVTAFMFGGFLGAYIANQKTRNKKVSAMALSKLDFIFFAYCLILLAILLGIPKIENPGLTSLFAEAGIPLLTLVVGFISGMEFPVAVKVYLTKAGKTVESASTLYTADLLGACIGAFTLSVIIIPLLGVIKVTLLLGLMNLATGLYILIKEKS